VTENEQVIKASNQLEKLAPLVDKVVADLLEDVAQGVRSELSYARVYDLHWRIGIIIDQMSARGSTHLVDLVEIRQSNDRWLKEG